MKTTKELIFILVGIILIASVAIILQLLDNGKFGDNTININTNNSFIELSEKNIEWKEITTFNPREIISKPKFEVGEKYIYRVWLNRYNKPESKLLELPYNYTSTIYIDKIERVNGSDYYVLREENISLYSKAMIKDEQGGWKFVISQNPNSFGGCIIKINKYNGSIIANPTFGTRCEVLEEMVLHPEYDILLFLDKNTKFIIGAKGISENQTKKKDVMEFEVKGIEMLDGRKCFRLETVRKFEVGSMLKSYQKGIYWIDVDKRILVKVKKYDGDILMKEIELEKIEK